MPEASAHIDKAEHNEKFAVAVRGLGTEFLDWVATAYFYSALHYLEAYLAANPIENTHRLTESGRAMWRTPFRGKIMPASGTSKTRAKPPDTTRDCLECKISTRT
jgi:hypothetical protein